MTVRTGRPQIPAEHEKAIRQSLEFLGLTPEVMEAALMMLMDCDSRDNQTLLLYMIALDHKLNVLLDAQGIHYRKNGA